MPAPCCQAHDSPVTLANVGQSFAEWSVAGLLFLLVPKCPMCVAAYVALFTGIGMSFTTAAYVRYGLLALCLLALAFVAVRTIRRSETKAV